MLEAKAKDEDRAASVLKKKGLQKSFSGNLQFIYVARIFDLGGPNHKSHAMTSSKFFKKGLFLGQRYRRMENPKLLP